MDETVTLWLYGLASTMPPLAGLTVLMATYGVFVLPIILAALWLAPANSQALRHQAVLAGCLAALVAFCVGLVLEHTLARPRPFVSLGITPLVPHAGDSSFPSDHTLVGVALVGALALRGVRPGVWLVLWALLVGVARVTAGLHFPSDIIGSALLALALDVLALRAIPLVLRRIRSGKID